MEEIQNQLEVLIDDVERDEKMTRSDLIAAKAANAFTVLICVPIMH